MAPLQTVWVACLAATVLAGMAAGQACNAPFTVATGSPGPYAIWNTSDAWLQQPVYEQLCNGGVTAYEIDTAVISNIYYSNSVNQNSPQVNIPFTIRLHCGDGSILSTCADSNTDRGACPLAVTGQANSLMPELVITNNTQISANNNLSPPLTISTNTPWMQLPGTFNLSASTAFTTLQCPSGSVWAGIHYSVFYGGINYFQMLCAPQCYTTETPGSEARTLTTPQPTVSGTGWNYYQQAWENYCGVSTTPISSIGPGPSNLYGLSNPSALSYPAAAAGFNSAIAAQDDVVFTLCPQGTWISQWDLRGFTNQPATAPWNFDTYVIENSTNGWTNFDALAYDYNPTDHLPYLDFLGVGGYTGNGFTCPPNTKAVGYQAQALSAGGVTLLNILCSAACAPTTSGTTTTSPSAPTSPSPSLLNLMGPMGAPMPSVAMQSPPPPPLSQAPPPPAGSAIFGCSNSVQAHIGPGGYGAFADAVAANNTSFLVDICPSNTFVVSWSYRTDTYTYTSAGQTQTTTLVGYLGATCSDGSTLQASTRQSVNASSGTWTNGSVYTDATESQFGYSSFDLTPLTQRVLQDFTGLDNGVVVNETVGCPTGFNAIGYSALSTFYGIPYLDIICGPMVSGCQPGPPGSGGQTSNVPGNNGQPFVYTSSAGAPSWQSYAPPSPNTPGTGARAPPPPNAPGDSISASQLTPTQTVLEVVIALTGANLWPFNTTLQVAFIQSIASTLGINPGLVHFIKASLTNPVTSASGRRLLELQASARQLLQADQTVYITTDIQAASIAQLAAEANELALLIKNGTFAKILAANGINATAILESTKAQTALSATDTPSTSSSGLSGGAIAGAVIGSVVGAAILAACAFFALKYVRRRRERLNSPAAGATANPGAFNNASPGFATPSRPVTRTGSKSGPSGQTNLTATTY
ncbi:hypothetical protein WJX73_010400 [Symbiochloris irregularis]|uniref:Uncharacterized protein n=1 Tax=Symbiochloris irregularis TaxID=706552 RepID=A0AAW1NRC9_9CHLO